MIYENQHELGDLGQTTRRRLVRGRRIMNGYAHLLQCEGGQANAFHIDDGTTKRPC
jgi:hypothetical protein